MPTLPVRVFPLALAWFLQDGSLTLIPFCRSSTGFYNPDHEVGCSPSHLARYHGTL